MTNTHHDHDHEDDDAIMSRDAGIMKAVSLKIEKPIDRRQDRALAGRPADQGRDPGILRSKGIMSSRTIPTALSSRGCT